MRAERDAAIAAYEQTKAFLAEAEVKMLLGTGQYLFPVLSDPEYALHKALGEPLTPYTIVCKPDGSVVYDHLGVVEDVDALYQHIKTLLD